MMRCEQVRQFFDAYLDGELSDALRTEIGAHRLQCADCRRALALLEVTGHILASDRDAVAASHGFTDRLMACIDTPDQSSRFLKLRRWAYVGGPLAAAAVVALAFLGFFDRPRTRVLGEKDVLLDVPPRVSMSKADRTVTDRPSNSTAGDVTQQRVSQFLSRLGENMNAVDQFNETTIRWLESIQPSPDSDLGEDEDASSEDLVGPPAPLVPVKNADPEIEEL